MSAQSIIIYDDEHVRAIYRPGRAGLTLATFSHFSFTDVSGRFWGQQLCDKEDFNAIGFVAKANNWFPEVAMRGAVAAARSLDCQNLITYGHSQGGYAALKYSAGLSAVGVLACAPQYSIDGRVTPLDRRFVGNYNETLNKNMEIQATDLAGRLVVVMDPHHAEDAYQMRLISKACPDQVFGLVAARYLGHQVMDLMREHAVVTRAISLCAGGPDNLELNLLVRSIGHRSWNYAINFTESVATSRPALAVRILKGFLERAQGVVPAAYQLHFSRVASVVYVRAGRAKEILPTLAAIVDANPGNQRIKNSYDSCLAAVTE